MLKFNVFKLGLLAALIFQNAWAYDCYDQGHLLPFNEDQVIQWKADGQSQTRGRAHIRGILTGYYPDRSKGSHQHFQIEVVGSDYRREFLEVVSSKEYGWIAGLQWWDPVEVCGDYITSNERHGVYPASPDNALIHWVHLSTNPYQHDSGFFALDWESLNARMVAQPLKIRDF